MSETISSMRETCPKKREKSPGPVYHSYIESLSPKMLFENGITSVSNSPCISLNVV